MDVKTIRELGVATAFRVPLTNNVRKVPSNFTTTPGSMVRVTPAATLTLPVRTYGLPAVVHVVFEAIVPLTLVVADAGAACKRPASSSATRTMPAASHRHSGRASTGSLP